MALSVTLKRDAVSDILLLNDLSQLNYSSYDHIYLTGFLPSVICRRFDISKQIRKKDLPNTLQYKFAYNLPLDPSEIWWWYRFLDSPDSDEYKICAVSINKSEFTRQIELLEKNNVKVDQCILSSLLASDDIFPDISKSGVPTEENFAAYIRKNQAEKYDVFVRKLNADIPDTCKLAFFAMISFLSTPGATSSVFPGNDMMPRGILPVRYRLLRKINLILMLFGLIFASVVLIERSSRSYSHYEALERKNSALRVELKKLQARNFQLGEEEKLLKEYHDLRVGCAGLENVLLEMTQKIPSYMWVKAFRISNNTLEMTIESSKDDINFYSTLKKGKLYELKNLRKNRGRSESFDYTVTLELTGK